MIRSYQLQLKGEPLSVGGRIFCEPRRYIITGNEWFTSRFVPGIICEETGVATIYPELDLLWIGWPEKLPERFRTLENFIKEFSKLPRWEVTRYVAVEHACMRCGDPEKNITFELNLLDCRTGQPLLDENGEPVPGREADVARLRRGIEQLMRGEHFIFM